MTLFNDFFSFSKGEKRGIIVLTSIIITLILCLGITDYFKINHQTDFSSFETAIQAFEKEQTLYFNSTKKPLKTSLFKFNPNTISNAEWKKLGFKEWQIKAINNYKLKGGSWKTKKDVQKIYGLSDSLYLLLKPFILLPEKIKPSSSTTKENIKGQQQYNSHSPSIPIININAADTSELKKLKGIGSVYAKRIVKYRDLLGGFVTINQLNEVYGLQKETFDQINEYLFIEDHLIKKLNINTASVKTLQAHPYFNWNTANAIVNYRKVHGNYTDIADVKKNHLITDKIYHKIAPYLTTH